MTSPQICPLRVTTALCFIAGCLLNPAHAAKKHTTNKSNQPQKNFYAKLGKGLSFTHAAENIKANLSAWMQADTAFYDSDVTPLNDGSAIRRGRVALTTDFFHDWHLRAEYDFTNKNLDISGFQDLNLRYTGIRHTSLLIGNLKEPIGLEWQTSSKNTTFMERALATALIPTYHLGFAASTHGKIWSLSGGIFGESLSDGINAGNGWGTAARVTFSPIHSKVLTLHFGLSATYRELGADSSRLRFNPRPEANVENIRFVTTDALSSVNDYKLTGLEFALLSSPFSLQAEYLRTFINRNRGRDDLQLDGWYIYGSWFLTGESRNYSPQSGKFGHIQPKHRLNFKDGFGAIELAARYSTINLNDQRIAGGRESNITLGINWYLNSYIRLMANYVFVRTDNNALGIRAGGSEQPEIFELRAQIAF